jgi:hypothetical protein
MHFLTSSFQLFFPFTSRLILFVPPSAIALLCSRIASTPSADNIDGDNWKLHLTLPKKNSQEPGFCNFPEQGSALRLLRFSLFACQMTSPLHFEYSHHLNHTVFVTARFRVNMWLNSVVFCIYWGLHWTGAVGWGTALQSGRSRVRLTKVSFKFFIDIILPAAIWPWGRLSL